MVIASRTPFGAWIERDVVRALGPEARSFLQGQLSQDVDAMATGDSRWSLLLEPTGKVHTWLRVTRLGDDETQLDTDAGFGAAMVERLERFKLRTKCDFTLAERTRCLAVRGRAGAGLPIVWPGVEGYDLLDAADGAPDGVPMTDGYERARIESGVPAMGRELTEATIPVEAGQWLIDASVSFTKGCFTGQELVARIDSRGGNAPRPIRGLRLTEPGRIGGEITTVAGDRVGTVTSTIDTVALASVQRALEPPADVLVDGVEARLVELPMR